jgi:hypothetical protein
MKTQLLSAAVLISCLAGTASAQVAELYNPGFEIPYPDFPTYVDGWRLNQAGQAQRREIGDGLLPVAQVHSGIASVVLPGANGNPNGNYQAVQSEEIVPGTFPPARNWPIYTFDIENGAPITVSFWFMIPAEDPMVESRFGLKAGFLRSGTNFSYYYTFDRLGLDDPSNVDPDTAGPVFPGCTIVTLGDGRRGIHTNGQWLQMSRTFVQQEVFVDEFGMPFAEPPTNPAYASVFAARFGPSITSQGIVWVDDFQFVQEDEECLADFDGNGTVQVPDIFAFLSAWFANDPSADIDGTPGISVPDIFAFLSLWFAGCN